MPFPPSIAKVALALWLSVRGAGLSDRSLPSPTEWRAAEPARPVGVSAPAVGLSRHLAPRNFPEQRRRHWGRTRVAVRSRCSWLPVPRRGVWGDVPSGCWNHLLRGSSLFLLCSALAVNLTLFVGGRETCVWTSWRAPRRSKSVSPLVCSWANFFWAQSAPSLGIWLVASDVCLTSRTFYEEKVLFGHCQLVLTCVCVEDRLCWGRVC